jgi:hypothetical protein
MMGHFIVVRVILKRNMNLTEKFDRYKKKSDLSEKCEISKISAKFHRKRKPLDQLHYQRHCRPQGFLLEISKATYNLRNYVTNFF